MTLAHRNGAFTSLGCDRAGTEGVVRLCHGAGVSTSKLDKIATRQHGVVTRAQALTVMTRGQLQRRVASGHLVRLRHTVYRVEGSPETWHQRLMAACLAAGDGAYVSFRAAAALWGFEGFAQDVLEVTVPAERRARLEGVTVHDSLVVGPAHVAILNRIPTASVARTLCDLSAVAPRWNVARAVDEALRTKRVTMRQLSAVAEDLDGQGRRRGTVIRAILEERSDGFQPGDSEPEVRIARLLVDAGLPAPVQQHRVQVGRRHRRLDLAYPELKIAIEYDGWAFHSLRGAFNRDHARGNELELLGWTVLRFTSASSDRAIVETVAAALARGSAIASK